jgi:hypothetical protein
LTENMKMDFFNSQDSTMEENPLCAALLTNLRRDNGKCSLERAQSRR